MVRPATHDDVPRIVAMAQQFYATLHYADWCEIDPDTADNLVRWLIDDHVFLVAESDGELVGMVGLVVSPFMFNRNVKCGHEVVWWVAPSHRGGRTALSLFQHAERAAKALGAGRLQMIHMPNSPPQAAGLYQRLGYSHSETCYTKDL